MDFSGFYKLPVEDRLKRLREAGRISGEDEKLLLDGDALKMDVADRMVENVVGRFHLPFSVVPGVVVNGKEYVVPMVIEEPSVVAACANGCKLARESGGFTADADEPIMIGEMQVVGVGKEAKERVLEGKERIMEKAKEYAAGVERYGGGMRGLEVREIQTARGEMLILMFEVDVR
ncbi:MAG TPA: hypothetical protein PKJ97_02555, partial [Candidatus Bilamarchaeaceae archaeon]|nr:hypothetical protein [Candidatus Bilamarchaeaceae archaeon]